MLIAAAEETQRGWGGPIALVVACLLFWLFVVVHRKITNPSPTPPDHGGTKAVGPAQRRFAISDTPAEIPRDTTADTGARPRDTIRDTRFPGRDTASPGPDTDADTAWWGRIVEVGGRRFRAAAHIARTGDSPPPEPERERDDFDDALDLVADEEPGTVEEWLERAAADGMTYGDMVRGAMDAYGISESSAKRRIRDMRA